MKKIFIMIFILFSIVNDVTTSQIKNVPDKKPDYLDDISYDVYLEQNFARTKPKQYAQILKEIVDSKQMTNTEAVQEAIKFLEEVSPREPLELSKEISRAGMDHVRDTGPTGLISHDGNDGSSPFDRMNRYGRWGSTAGECISYGMQTGRDIVLQLIIDEGVPSRGHRDNIFKVDFKICGVAYGIHSIYSSMCVIDYAGYYTPKK